MQEPERHHIQAEPPQLILESGRTAGSRLPARAITAGAVIASAALLAAPAVSYAQAATTPSSTTPATGSSTTTAPTTTTPTSTTPTSTTPTNTTPTTTSTAPANSKLPVITGTARVGEKLSCSAGTWSGAPAPTLTYQWERDGKPIPGATTSHYTILSGDAGDALRCVVRATNSSGSVPASSAKVKVAAKQAGAPGNGGGTLGSGTGSGAGGIGGTHQTKHRHKPSRQKKARKHHKRHRTHKPAAATHTARKSATGTVLPAGNGTVTELGPSWGGSSIFNNPFTIAQLEQFAGLAGTAIRPPAYLVPIYRAAARRYQVPWQVLAAINYIETGYGKDLAVSSAGAVGWMQFMPSTWAQYGEVISKLELEPATKAKHRRAARHTSSTRPTTLAELTPFGAGAEKRTMTPAELTAQQTRQTVTALDVAEKSPADRRLSARQRHQQALREARMLAEMFGPQAASVRTADGEPNPWNPTDAIFAAAKMLTADGAHRNMARAVYSYNHANWYVEEVLTVAQKITVSETAATRGTVTVHGSRRPGTVSAVSRLEAMRTEARLLNGIAYVWGGGHAYDDWVVNTGYDCSGFVSAVLHAGGYLTYPVTTQTLPGQPGVVSGPGRYVTIYDRTDAGISDDHVIIDLGGQWWESGGGSGSGGAAMVHRITQVSRGYLQSFNLVLHPSGM